MTLRCRKCHATVWIQPIARESGAAVSCGQCGQEYVVKAWGKQPGGERSLAIRARRLAKQQHLDLPGAYSVLLGVATVEELRELGDAASPSCRTARAAGPRPRQFDRAFQSAIDAGRMTAIQAAERGNREAWISSLRSRHRLPTFLAEDVADNKVSLLEALRRQPPAEGAVRVRMGNRWLVPLTLSATLFVVAVVAAAVRNTDATFVDTEETSLTVGTAEVRTDSSGRVVQVLGPDPRSVLDAFSAATNRRLEPLAVLPSTLAGERTRVGLLRDPQHPDDLRAITIREDRESGRWRAGEKGRPLVADPAPEGAATALRWH